VVGVIMPAQLIRINVSPTALALRKEDVTLVIISPIAIIVQTKLNVLQIVRSVVLMVSVFDAILVTMDLLANFNAVQNA